MKAFAPMRSTRSVSDSSPANNLDLAHFRFLSAPENPNAVSMRSQTDAYSVSRFLDLVFPGTSRILRSGGGLSLEHGRREKEKAKRESHFAKSKLRPCGWNA